MVFRKTYRLFGWQIDASYCWMMLVVLVGLAFRLFFFMGYQGIGSTHEDIFAKKAYELASAWGEGNFWGYQATTSAIEFRVGLVFPLAVLFYFFGVSEITAVSFTLACSLLNLVLVVCIGKRLFNFKTGILAGMLLAIFPVDVLYASVVWPDPGFCLFQLVAVWMFLNGLDEGGEHRKYAWFYGSGFAVGIAYLSKVSALLILPFFIYWLWRERLSWKIWMLGGLGLVSLLIVEGLYWYGNTGDFFHRINFFNPLHDAHKTSDEVLKAVSWEHFGDRVVLGFPSLMLNLFNRKIIYMGLMGWFLVFSIFYFGKRKDQTVYVLFWWIGLAYLGIDLLPMNLSPLAFAHNLKSVYLLPIIYPMVILIARFLIVNYVLQSRRTIALGLLLLLSCLVGSGLASLASGRHFAYNSREIAHFIKTHVDEGPFVVDWATRKNLEFLLAYQVYPIVTYEEVDLSQLEKGWVVVNEAMLYRKISGYAVPDEIQNLPPNWQKNIEIRDPFYRKRFFVTMERLISTLVGPYAFVMHSGESGTPVDVRSLVRVFEDFQRPAILYRVMSAE